MNFTTLLCDKGKLHDGEPLNRVCLYADCKADRLLCVLCQQQNHKGHHTKHIKSIIQDLHSDSLLKTSSMAKLTFQLDRTYLNFIQQVRQAKSKINRQLQALEEMHHINYNGLKQKITKLLNMSMSQDPIQRHFQWPNTQIARSQLASLISSLYQKDQKVLKPLRFQKTIDQWVRRLRLSSTNFSDVKENCILSIKQISESFKAHHNFQFWFSKTDKSNKVNIEQKGKKSLQTINNSNGQRFALIQPSLTSLGIKATIGFKISKVVGWVGLGICIKHDIKEKQYKFNHQKIGHGSYMISQNGYCWSHSDAGMNSVLKSYIFQQGDQIVMHYDYAKKTVTFVKGSGQSTTLTIAQLGQGQEYAACVNLCNSGDSVTIIQPKKKK